jgi:hypothetical protein
MVQGRLLTAHPGGDHGGGAASGGQSSLRQGAGTASPGDPEIGIAAAVKQWTKLQNGAPLEGFRSKGNK